MTKRPLTEDEDPLTREAASEALNHWSYRAHKRVLTKFVLEKPPRDAYSLSQDAQSRIHALLERRLRELSVTDRGQLVAAIGQDVLGVVNRDRNAFFTDALTRLDTELGYVKKLFRESTEPARDQIIKLSRRLRKLKDHADELGQRLDRAHAALRESNADQARHENSEWATIRKGLLPLFRAIYADQTEDDIDNLLSAYVQQAIYRDLIRRSTIEAIAAIKRQGLADEDDPARKLIQAAEDVFAWQERLRRDNGLLAMQLVWLFDESAAPDRPDLARRRGLNELTGKLAASIPDSHWLRQDDALARGARINMARSGVVAEPSIATPLGQIVHALKENFQKIDTDTIRRRYLSDDAAAADTTRMETT